MKNLQVTLYLMVNVFTLILGKRQGCLFSPFLFSIVPEVSARTIRQEQKELHIEEEEVKWLLFTDNIIVSVRNAMENYKKKNWVYEFLMQEL